MTRTAYCYSGSHTFAWILPITFAVLLAGVWSTKSNEAIFYSLNGLSIFTGEWIWANITLLGDTLIVMAIGFAFSGRRPEILWALILAGLLATPITQGLKEILDIARPPAVLSPHEIQIIGDAHRSNAFPSGHTATAFLLAAVLSYCLQRTSVTVLAISLAMLVGISRIVVGVHWPLDVLAGAMIGWVCGYLGAIGARNWKTRNTITVQRILALLFGAACLTLLGYDSGYENTIPLQSLTAIICLGLGLSGLYQSRQSTR